MSFICWFITIYNDTCGLFSVKILPYPLLGVTIFINATCLISFRVSSDDISGITQAHIGLWGNFKVWYQVTIFLELHKQFVWWLDFGAGFKLITHCYILFVWVVHAKDMLCMSVFPDLTLKLCLLFIIHSTVTGHWTVHCIRNTQCLVSIQTWFGI